MYPQRLHFLQHFFLLFTFLLLSQVSLHHVQTPHTFFLFYIMPKRFTSDLKSQISKSKHWPYNNTLLKYARSGEKYTAGGGKIRENTVVWQLLRSLCCSPRLWSRTEKLNVKLSRKTTKAACAGWNSYCAALFRTRLKSWELLKSWEHPTVSHAWPHCMCYSHFIMGFVTLV